MKMMQMDLNILGRRNPLKNRSKPTEAKVEEAAKEAEASVKPKSKSNRFAIQQKVCKSMGSGLIEFVLLHIRC